MECVTCMCLARGVGDLGGEWVTGLGLGFTNSVGICVGVLVAVVWVVFVGGEWVGSLDQGPRVWCGVMYVCVVSLDSLC